MVQVKYVVHVLQHSVTHQQRAELADLLEEQRAEPVLAVELVVLHIRKHEMAQAEHLIERNALRIARQQRTIFGYDSGALLPERLRRPIDAHAGLDLRDVTRESGKGYGEIFVPAAVVMIKPIAHRSVEPG